MIHQTLISEEITAEIVIFVVSLINSKNYILQSGDVIFIRLHSAANIDFRIYETKITISAIISALFNV